MNDIVISKMQSIHRCIGRAREERQKAGDLFSIDFTRQDAAVLNITRACEMSIDLANHIIRREKLGIPMSSAESFTLLARKGIIPTSLEDKLINMVGFRNTAIHAYQKLKIEIIEAVIKTGLDDLLELTELLRNR